MCTSIVRHPDTPNQLTSSHQNDQAGMLTWGSGGHRAATPTRTWQAAVKNTQRLLPSVSCHVDIVCLDAVDSWEIASVFSDAGGLDVHRAGPARVGRGEKALPLPCVFHHLRGAVGQTLPHSTTSQTTSYWSKPQVKLPPILRQWLRHLAVALPLPCGLVLRPRRKSARSTSTSRALSVSTCR